MMKQKSFIVIGMGRFGANTARKLTEMGHEVLAVDKSAARIGVIKDDVLRAIQADATDERVIAQLGVRNFDGVIVSIGDDVRSSILATVLCREAGARRIVAKAQDDLHEKLLLKTGADRVVQPERDAGVRLARSMAADGVLDSFGLSDKYGINEMLEPEGWVGKSLMDLNLRKKHGLSVIALRREGEVEVNIDPAMQFVSGDLVYALGTLETLERL